MPSDEMRRVQWIQWRKEPTAMPAVDRSQLVDDVRQALYAAKICSYAQVMPLVSGGSRTGREHPVGVPLAWCSVLRAVTLPFGGVASCLVPFGGVASPFVLCHLLFVVQGMNLIREAAHQLGWSVNLGECARIWKGGCIIRARFLDR